MRIPQYARVLPLSDTSACQLLPRPRVGVGMRLRTILLALLLLLAMAAPAGAATRGLEVGFTDDLFTSANAADRGWSLDAARSSGASIVRINLFWRSVAPTRPAAPQDPADPAYRWANYDAGVRDAQARGLTVLLTITGAPPWAEGAGPQQLGRARHVEAQRCCARRLRGRRRAPLSHGHALAGLERAEPQQPPRAAVDPAQGEVRLGRRAAVPVDAQRGLRGAQERQSPEHGRRGRGRSLWRPARRRRARGRSRSGRPS